jgi:hypothetical protein
MIIVSSFEFSSQNLWMKVGCVLGFVVLSLWSAWSVRRGKPAIPKFIQILVPLMVYLFYLQDSLPYTRTPAETKRSPEQLARSEKNTRLRDDLDRALSDLDRLNDVTTALLNFAVLAGMFFIADWLGVRLDDRNWIHGGIRPPPGTQIDEDHHAENRTKR